MALPPLRGTVCEMLRGYFPALVFQSDLYSMDVLIYKKQPKHNRSTHTPIGKIYYEDIRDLRYDYMMNYCQDLTKRVTDGQ